MTALYAIGFGVLGVAVGWAYFALMRYSLIQLGRERGSAGQFIGLAVLRLILFAGGLAGAALVGTWSFLAYAVGFIIARTVAVARARAVDKNTGRPSQDGRSDAQ